MARLDQDQQARAEEKLRGLPLVSIQTEKIERPYAYETGTPAGKNNLLAPAQDRILAREDENIRSGDLRYLISRPS